MMANAFFALKDLGVGSKHIKYNRFHYSHSIVEGGFDEIS